MAVQYLRMKVKISGHNKQGPPELDLASSVFAWGASKYWMVPNILCFFTASYLCVPFSYYLESLLPFLCPLIPALSAWPNWNVFPKIFPDKPGWLNRSHLFSEPSRHIYFCHSMNVFYTESWENIFISFFNN